MAGQIVRRGDRRWLVRIYLGRDRRSGKRLYHNHTIHGSKKDAEQYRTKKLRERDLGLLVEPSRVSVDSYLDQWLETAAKQRVRPRTFEDYTWLLNKYVRPRLGRQRLDQVQPFDLQELYTEMQKRGISARTVRYTHSVLSSAFKQAVRWQKLAHDPTGSVDLPRRVRREMRALTVEEVKRFQDAASNDPRGIIFIFLIATGARPSEALALRWSDTDLEKGIVTIRRTLVRLKGSWHFAEPKTAKSRRAIPLPGGMVRALKDHRRLQAEQRLRRDPKHEDHDLVFATATGAPLDLHNLTNRHFKPILHAAGLPKVIRIYDLWPQARTRRSCPNGLATQV